MKVKTTTITQSRLVECRVCKLSIVDIPIQDYQDPSLIYMLMTHSSFFLSHFSADLFFKNLFLNLVRSSTTLEIIIFIKGLLLTLRYFSFSGHRYQQP